MAAPRRQRWHRSGTVRCGGRTPGVAAGLLGALLAGLLLGSAAADAPREVSWPDLLPPDLPAVQAEVSSLERHLRSLPTAERQATQRVVRKLMSLDGSSVPETVEAEVSEPERKALREAVDAASYDAALAFWTAVKGTRARLKALEAAVDQGLDGQRIRMPGYALPLEFDGDTVHEFLLVPYVGACIHVPPPPPNQMVFVSTGTGFRSRGLFTPVWVEGTLHARAGTYTLSLVDGESAVNAGYSLAAERIEPFER